LFGRKLRGERRRLTRALEAARTGARPRNGVAGDVRDRDDGVVEGRLNARDSGRDVLLDLLLTGLRGCAALACLLRLRACHDEFRSFLRTTDQSRRLARTAARENALTRALAGACV